MVYKQKHITVFEHQAIKLNQEIEGVKFDVSKLKAMQSYYGENGVPYFSLIHNGIRFNEYVGVIQVGDTVIEVLPKADTTFSDTLEEKCWRDILIEMLFAVGIFDIHAPSISSLKLKSNSILDLYFELFIIEVEYLLHSGLVKQYRRKEGNVTSLKGSLKFGRHLQQNLTHQERFYVRHATFDFEHKLHYIIYKTILLLKEINTTAAIHSRIGALLLTFPTMPDIKVSENTFDRIIYNRKTLIYKKSIDIAHLLLLHFHPDLKKGKDHILALMFDMNYLWEQFVCASLRKHKESSTTVTAQTSKLFWKSRTGCSSKIRPDIVLNKDKENCVVLDTKWKNLKSSNPSPDDLRQMFVYHDYYNAQKVALVYPGSVTENYCGTYYDPKTNKESEKECSIISLSVEFNLKRWQKNIYAMIQNWINAP